VRFLKTGSEATLAARMIAKAATKRDLVLVGDWAYHGWHEWCEREADGVTPEDSRTVHFPHGMPPEDFAAMLRLKGWHPSMVAAVFIEPHRWETVDVAWLKAVREFCTRAGALLVFDEMIYGGRWAFGGATQYFGVDPDLACFGKAFGNGESVAFVVGREAMAAHGELVSGTYSGDVAGLDAVRRVVHEYVLPTFTPPVLEALWARGRQLQRGLREVAEASVKGNGCILAAEGAPVHQRLRFRDHDTALEFGAEMASRGVLVHWACINLSASHTPELVERVVDAAYLSMKALR
jgi:glutamate-1-semialdehyde 2,1-aminomutase